jgi:hypothetical protein
MSERCDTCKFWKFSGIMGDSGHKGWCRRYPPVVSFQGLVAVPMVPQTNERQWCGEWQQKGGE